MHNIEYCPESYCFNSVYYMYIAPIDKKKMDFSQLIVEKYIN